MEQGGPFAKINKNKLHRFYFCRKYGSKRMRDLKGHLTLLTLTLLYRKEIRRSAVAITIKNRNLF